MNHKMKTLLGASASTIAPCQWLWIAVAGRSARTPGSVATVKLPRADRQSIGMSTTHSATSITAFR